ncbi:hypothetical protein OG782_12190 [Streptomyces sp. NBC_00876]|uniref:hypothetical protein n=1 Tax=Streptomyces sp. NBC_00876 TaxID=2975853 RepID=UPI003870CE15|nr:hypothetical protein OG782_12190 [Streptomyces sp. NBC_00876]
MSKLIRAPRECGSWFWDLYDIAPAGLESALSTAAQMTEVLDRLDLLTPVKLEYRWHVLGIGTTGITTSLEVTEPLSSPSLPGRVLGSRPTAFPASEIGHIHIRGTGTWIDAAGKSQEEMNLINLTVSPAPVGLSAELSVHHDIWGKYDFSGHPHPALHQYNAPRLTAALQGLSSLFDMAPELGEPTYFGTATLDGLATPDAYDDGLGPDLTSWL